MMNKYNKEEAPKTRESPVSSRIWLGLFILVIGIALLGQKLGLPLPEWLFTWPALLIVIGVGIGIKDRFQNPGSWIMVLIGSVFLADRNVNGMDFHRFLWPAILIIIGLTFILRPKRNRNSGRFNFGNRSYPYPKRGGHGFAAGDPTSGDDGERPEAEDTNAGSVSGAEFDWRDDHGEILDINSVFGGIKRFVVSKNFQGGAITTFMGGAEINLVQADISHTILIDISNLFGGTKLIVPANWTVKNEVSAVFGGVEDKRNLAALVPDKDKILLLKGICVFGGIELRSY